MCIRDRVLKQAKAEGRSFSFIVSRAIERDLESRTVQADPPLPPPGKTDTIYTKEVAQLLDVSERTVLRRASLPGDPLHAARARLGKQKPLAFSLAKIRALQRGLVAAATFSMVARRMNSAWERPIASATFTRSGRSAAVNRTEMPVQTTSVRGRPIFEVFFVFIVFPL